MLVVLLELDVETDVVLVDMLVDVLVPVSVPVTGLTEVPVLAPVPVLIEVRELVEVLVFIEVPLSVLMVGVVLLGPPFVAGVIFVEPPFVVVDALVGPVLVVGEALVGLPFALEFVGFKVGHAFAVSRHVQKVAITPSACERSLANAEALGSVDFVVVLTVDEMLNVAFRHCFC